MAAILVPNVLDNSPDKLDRLYSLVSSFRAGRAVLLDLCQVEFVYPSGIVGMALFLRSAQERIGRKLVISGCKDNILAYLHRINFFDTCREWATCTMEVPSDSELARSEASTNLLELRPIRNHDEVNLAANRAQEIIRSWLTLDSSQLNNLVIVLSEMGGNVCDHSNDYGFICIQKYLHRLRGIVVVRIAVGDMGIGIRRSLMRRYRNIGSTSIAYVKAALQGKTSRPGRSIRGNGFQRVQEIVKGCRGSLFVRSGDGAVLIPPASEEMIEYPKLLDFPGTFVAITLNQRISHIP